jgi:2-polyprenyl-3-methyl-5-hydroxy-6-metoxy-1,4-benzoquinol methylase
MTASYINPLPNASECAKAVSYQQITKFVERDSRIVKMVSGKTVLHLGCVGFTDGTPEEKIAMARRSLHASLTEAACACTGVDLDGGAIRELQSLGIFTNVIEGDVERLPELGRELGRYDVVVAGDIIEHVSNPGLMLDGIKPRMNEDGILLVSTPNAFGIASWIKYAQGRFREGEQHVLCFNPITLRQLLERHGYEVTEALSCYQSRAAGQYGASFQLLRRILDKLPRFGGTLLCVCRVKHDVR